ncbi:hypothetical protein ACI2KE_18820 [Pseudomonas monteilii]
MSKWTERRKRLGAESDYDPLISIPMLEPGTFNLVQARRRITSEFDSKNSKNITIIDPYLLESDIDVVLDLFATQPDRKITIITFLGRVKQDEKMSPEKVEAAKIIQSIVADIERQGVFSSFEIIKTGFNFHDRFFVCTDQDKDGIVISSGGSLSMLLTDYSGLIRITNKTYKRSLLQFIEYAKKNGSTLPDFIAEQS